MKKTKIQRDCWPLTAHRRIQKTNCNDMNCVHHVNKLGSSMWRIAIWSHIWRYDISIHQMWHFGRNNLRSPRVRSRFSCWIKYSEQIHCFYILISSFIFIIFLSSNQFNIFHRYTPYLTSNHFRHSHFRKGISSYCQTAQHFTVQVISFTFFKVVLSFLTLFSLEGFSVEVLKRYHLISFNI